MCGFSLGKFNEPSLSMLLLGANVAISPDFVSASLPPGRRGALISDISTIFLPGRLSPSLAEKLMGAVVICTIINVWQVWTRAPEADREQAIFTFHPVAEQAEFGSPRCSSLVEFYPSHGIRAQDLVPRPRPAAAYVDAAGCGHLGVVLFVDDQRLVFSTHIPEWMAREKCGIF